MGRGGAETLIVQVCRALPAYEHVIVTLFDVNHFTAEELENVRYVSLHLNMRDLFLFQPAVRKFRKCIQQLKPNLVHAHLLWPTVIARCAVPKEIPLITTIHGYVSQLIDYRKWYFRLLDRFTFRKRPTVVIAVSEGALEEYLRFLKNAPAAAYVLYTYADNDVFKPRNVRTFGHPLRLVSVGALRYQKNQHMLIDILQHLKEHPVELHIYGAGDMETTLAKHIHETGAKVVLKGQTNQVAQVVRDYDAMIMSSFYEGFSIGVLEAMSVRLPLILSDIPSFKEQCGEEALYFSLTDVASGVRAVLALMENPEAAFVRADNALERVQQHFSKEQHLKKLQEIYNKLI
jgi:glycosyltransferase involved in cell wall biosynthesis